jgi:AcrR family transcriptional regulator
MARKKEEHMTSDGASYRNVATESRRQAILQAALKSFLSKGFTNTTMDDIRQLSGASTGSIYHHFENKEMLAVALYREGRSDLNNTLARAFASTEPDAGIKMLVYSYLDWFELNPDLGLYIIQAANTEYLGRHVEAFRQKVDTLPQHFFTWLTPFVEQGRIIRYPQQLYIPLALGPGREYVRRWLQGRIPGELHDVRDLLADAAWLVLSQRS